MTILKVLLGITALLFTFSYVSGECEIDPFTANSPILIQRGNTSVVNPVRGQKTVKFAAGEIVEFACPQTRLVIEGQLSTLSIVEATCVSNTRFRIQGERYLWRQVVCNANPIPIGRYLNSNCGTNARLAEIGFDLGSNRFVRTITVCFNSVTQIPLYTYFDLTSSIGSRDLTTPRPSFAQDNGFYNVGTTTVNALYGRARQRSTINGLVGLAATSTKYIDNGLYNFLSRGHLTARADYIYGALQNATFRYINSAPQWQTFNGYNWNQAEIDTRNYADSRNVQLQVWTGTYGITTLPHETTGADIPLYLYVNGTTRALPVPAIFWKIVYNPTNRQGIVLIGLNNPFENNVSKYVICPDVSAQVTWLNWAKNDIRQGYSYACTVANFRKVVTTAPSLTASGLLV